MFELVMTLILICLVLFFILMGMDWETQNKVGEIVQKRTKLILWDLYWLSPLSMLVEWTQPIPERIVIKEVIKEVVKELPPIHIETRGVNKFELHKEAPITIVMGGHQVQCWVMLRNAQMNMSRGEWDGSLKDRKMELEFDIVNDPSYRQMSFEPIL